MRKNLILLFLIITCSCKKENNGNFLYGVLNENLQKENEILRIRNEEMITQYGLKDNQNVTKYHYLTVQYLDYLENVEIDLIEKLKVDKSTVSEEEISKNDYVNDYFFDKDNDSEAGNVYLIKLDKYKKEIQDLTTEPNVKKRSDLLLTTENILNKKGEEIKYLEYFFKNNSLIGVLAFIENKKRTIIEIEYDFITNEILTKENLQPTTAHKK